MKLLINLFVVIISLSQMITATKINNNGKCDDDRKTHIDLVAQRFMMFGPNGRRFPETMQQVPKYCRESSNYLDEIKTYFTECENNYNQKLAKIVIYSLRRMIRVFCHHNHNHKSSSSAKDSMKKLRKLIAASKCVNRYRMKFECLDRYARLSWPLINATTMSGNRKIDFICCNYHQTMQCLDQFNDSQECLRKDQQMFREFVEQIFANVINVFCIGPNSPDTIDEHCKQIEHERPKFMENDRNFKYNSSMMVTFAILNSMQRSN